LLVQISLSPVSAINDISNGIRERIEERIHVELAGYARYTTESFATTEFQYKYPFNDELTENASCDPYYYDKDDAMFQCIPIQGFGNWSDDLDYLWISTKNKVHGAKSVGGYRFGGNIIPFMQFFVFEETFDASKFDAFSFWVRLDEDCEDYVVFGVLDENVNIATIFFDCASGGDWEWKKASLTDLSAWEVDPGFDWSKIVLVLFATDAFGDPEYPKSAWTLIDDPMFYSSHLPWGLIDTDEIESDSGRLCVELIHAGPEFLPEEFYMIHATFKKKCSELLPYLRIMIQVDSAAEEFPDNHLPKDGYYSSETIATFSIPGIPISFPVNLPQLRVSYNHWYEGNLYKIEWKMEDPYFIDFLGVGTNVINDYADFAVAIKVPSNFKPYIAVMAEAKWYEFIEIFKGWPFPRGMYNLKKQEQLCWCIVDPPEAPMISPQVPSPLPSKFGTFVDSFTQKGGLGIYQNTRSFRPGENLQVISYIMDHEYLLPYKDIGFELIKDGVTTAKLAARTNESRIAQINYQLPSSKEEIGSVWNLIVTVCVRGTVYFEEIWFLLGYGDLNGDVKVDMKDIALVARAFGSDYTNSTGKWNPVADVTGISGIPDEKVDMRDISVVAKEFGNSGNPPLPTILYDDTFSQGWSVFGGTLTTDGQVATATIQAGYDSVFISKPFNFYSSTYKYAIINCVGLTGAWSSWRLEVRGASDQMWYNGPLYSSTGIKNIDISTIYFGAIDMIGIRVFGSPNENGRFDFIAISARPSE
jgi:hypothetical protein